MDLNGAAKAVGVSRETLRPAILAGGALKGKRSGRDDDGEGTGKYLIAPDALAAWFEALPDA